MLASAAFKMVNQSVMTSKHRKEGTGKVTDFFAAGYSAVLQLWCLAFLLFVAFLTYAFIISSFMHITFMRPLLSRAVSLVLLPELVVQKTLTLSLHA